MVDKKESRFWDHLLQLIGERRVVPIIGEDLLQLDVDGRRTSLYAMLAKRLADYLDVSAEDLPAGGELDAVARRFLALPGRHDVEDVYAGVKSVMPDEGALPVPEALLQLAEIPLQLYVTTTFDSLMARALDEKRGGSPARRCSFSLERADDIPDTLDGPPIVYQLLGRVSTVPDYAVTEEDVLEFVHTLQTETHRPTLLFDELSRKQLLILGCSFPDWLARFFIRTAAGERLSIARGKNFVADVRMINDRNLVDFLESFSLRTQLLMDWSAVNFVSELYDRCAEAGLLIGAAPPPTESRPESGAVFLSYASEDRQAAMCIKDALERAGISVWFDRDLLKHGDKYEEVIRDRIRDCSLFVPVVSRHAITPERRWFRIEWSEARRVEETVAASQRFILPVVIDNTSPDEPDLRQFKNLNWTELPDGRPTSEFVENIRSDYLAYHRIGEERT